MTKSDDTELLRARILSARNRSSLSTSTIKAVKGANHIKARYVEVCLGSVPTTFQNYAIVCVHKEELNLDAVKQREDGSEVVRERRVLVSREDITDIWEVRGLLPSTPEIPGSWVYEEAAAAASAFAYLLGKHVGAKSDTDPERAIDLRFIVGDILLAAGLENSLAVPRMPQDDDDTAVVEVAALMASAIEARNAGTSTRLRKQIAVDLYRKGETNIRHISRLTGLARDTVYKALQDEHIERVIPLLDENQHTSSANPFDPGYDPQHIYETERRDPI